MYQIRWRELGTRNSGWICCSTREQLLKEEMKLIERGNVKYFVLPTLNKKAHTVPAVRA